MALSILFIVTVALSPFIRFMTYDYSFNIYKVFSNISILQQLSVAQNQRSDIVVLRDTFIVLSVKVPSRSYIMNIGNKNIQGRNIILVLKQLI